MGSCTLQQSCSDSLTVTTITLPLQKPHVGAPLEVRKEYLDAQLDTLVGKCIHGNIVVLGPQFRMHGGVPLY
jgi:hypothetical protein